MYVRISILPQSDHSRPILSSTGEWRRIRGVSMSMVHRKPVFWMFPKSLRRTTTLVDDCDDGLGVVFAVVVENNKDRPSCWWSEASWQVQNGTHGAV